MTASIERNYFKVMGRNYLCIYKRKYARGRTFKKFIMSLTNKQIVFYSFLSYMYLQIRDVIPSAWWQTLLLCMEHEMVTN